MLTVCCILLCMYTTPYHLWAFLHPMQVVHCFRYSLLLVRNCGSPLKKLLAVFCFWKLPALCGNAVWTWKIGDV